MAQLMRKTLRQLYLIGVKIMDNTEKLESMKRLRDDIKERYNKVLEDICEHEYAVQNIEGQLKKRLKEQRDISAQD